EEVPDTMETLPIGQAQVIRQGNDITLISYGASLRPTLEAAEILEEEDHINAEVIDLLTLVPMDVKTIIDSVRKNGRAVVVHEGPRTCGIASEVVSLINEHVFLYLEAPVQRVTGYDIPIPYFSKEKFYLPDADRVISACRQALKF